MPTSPQSSPLFLASKARKGAAKDDGDEEEEDDEDEDDDVMGGQTQIDLDMLNQLKDNSRAMAFGSDDEGHVLGGAEASEEDDELSDAGDRLALFDDSTDARPVSRLVSTASSRPRESQLDVSVNRAVDSNPAGSTFVASSPTNANIFATTDMETTPAFSPARQPVVNDLAMSPDAVIETQLRVVLATVPLASAPLPSSPQLPVNQSPQQRSLDLFLARSAAPVEPPKIVKPIIRKKKPTSFFCGVKPGENK